MDCCHVDASMLFPRSVSSRPSTSLAQTPRSPSPLARSVIAHIHHHARTEITGTADTCHRSRVVWCDGQHAQRDVLGDAEWGGGVSQYLGVVSHGRHSDMMHVWRHFMRRVQDDTHADTHALTWCVFVFTCHVLCYSDDA